MKKKKRTVSANNSRTPPDPHRTMHEHALAPLQLRLDDRAQLAEALEQVLVALIAFRDVNVVDPAFAEQGQGLVGEISVHDGEDEVDVERIVRGEVLGGVGSGRGCLVAAVGLVITRGQRGERTAPAKKEIGHDLVHG